MGTSPNLLVLEQSVRDLYEKRDPNRDEWSDWLYANHIFVVADFAEELAIRYKADVEQCRAVATLHDIADATMSRFSPNHEEESLVIARQLLARARFNNEDIAIMVDDAIALHSCRDGQRPKSLVGNILATADALAHLNTDYYAQTTGVLMQGRPAADIQNWAARKIPRDYHIKIAFDNVREEARPAYESLCKQFHLDPNAQIQK